MWKAEFGPLLSMGRVNVTFSLCMPSGRTRKAARLLRGRSFLGADRLEVRRREYRLGMVVFVTFLVNNYNRALRLAYFLCSCRKCCPILYMRRELRA